MAEAMQSPADVSAAAHVPGEGTYLRLEGIAPSVVARRDRLVKILGRDAGILGEKDSAKVWTSVRDVKPLWSRKDSAIWRVSVTPTEGAAIAARICSAVDATHYFDWAGGLIWLAVSGAADGGAAIIREACAPGHATLLRARDDVRTAVDAFTPQPPALAALSRRVKASFDPDNRFNPGIMVKG
jgi:glycolate oxidase FAD binding subunit